MLEHPDLIGGKGSIDTEIMQLTEGRVLARLGAEGLLCVALPERGIGIAISDGSGSSPRALGPALVRVLEQLALADGRTTDPLRQRYRSAVRNLHGDAVGHIASPLTLERCWASPHQHHDRPT